MTIFVRVYRITIFKSRWIPWIGDYNRSITRTLVKIHEGKITKCAHSERYVRPTPLAINA